MDFWENLGLKAGVVVAGMVGSVVSLSMIRNLSPLGALGTVVGGTACAAYITPLVVEYSGLTGSSEHALAFFLGVCGMNGVAGIFKISERFRDAPAKTLNEIRKGELSDD